MPGYAHHKIDSHIKKLGSPKRYQLAFAVLFAMALRDGLTIDSPSDSFAGLLLELDSYSSSTARNAYSALLLIPGFQSIRFHPLLSHVRKSWNKHTPKYAAFWDPIPVFWAFINTSYDLSVIKEVRIKLILLWRFLGLFRSFDLSRTLRQVSSVGTRRFVAVRRNNKSSYRWEEVLVLKDKSWCPWETLLLYVSLTSSLVAPGTPLLITLRRPYTPLAPNTVGSLTAAELKRFGIDTSVWGAHTTRGAFVEFFRWLGLPSEVVASIGQWENWNAFAKHYLRVGASGEAKKALDDVVHTTSHESCCSGDVPQTHQEPVLQVMRGGSGTEQRQQDTGEPTPPSPVVSSSASKRPRGRAPEPPRKLPRLESVSSSGRVRKSHCLVFLGGLDPGQAPFKTLLLMLRLT